MKADETRLDALLGRDTQYAVPYFQRSYSWTRLQWRTLQEDIFELYESGSAHVHFMGSLVFMRQDQDGSYLIIDGQQRLVTLCLFLAALRDSGGPEVLGASSKTGGAGFHPAQTGWKPVLPSSADQLPAAGLDSYLVESGGDVDARYKVLCTYQDRAAFASVVDGAEDPPFSPITEAYRFFKGSLNDKDPARLAGVVLTQLSFVAITLGPEDNPYRIFESLNAKGMPLTQGDLMRNYFFMRLPREEHEHWFRTVWTPMQNLLGGAFDDFMRDALVKRGEFVRANEVYQGWRRLLGPADTEAVRDTLRELTADAADYDGVLHPQREPSQAVRKRLERLTLWSGTVVHPFRPFLLRVYGGYRRGRLSEEQTERVLFAVESFLVRRLFTGTPPADDNRLFLEEYGRAPPDQLPRVLAGPRHGWPSDEAFAEAIVSYPLFLRSHPDQRRLVLQALEESYSHRRPLSFDRLEIEFVAPLLARPEWLAELGGDEELHWRLVGTLGNLTWGIKGRSPSLHPAERRKELLELVRYGYELPRDLAGIERWTAEAIRDRSRRMAERALAVWPRPE